MKPLIHLLIGLTCATAVPAHALAQWSADSLSPARSDVAAATIGDLVFFAGGRDGSTVYDVVNIYDAATDSWSVAHLSVPRAGVAATVVDDLVLFAGGVGSALSTTYKIVDVFDTGSMTMTGLAAPLSARRGSIAATTVGRKAFFAGGSRQGNDFAIVDIYDAEMGTPDMPSAWSIEFLSQPRAAATAASVGGLAIFAGGWVSPGGVPVNDVDIYDPVRDSWATTTLSEARILGPSAAAVVGSRAYFGGGHISGFGGPNMTDAIDIYDALTGAWSAAQLSEARGYVGVTAVGNTVLFASGVQSGFIPSPVIDTLNVGTGKWGTLLLPSPGSRGLAAATIHGKAMFAGGWDSVGVTDQVDVYTPVGTNYCMAEPNSTGAAATISALGSTSVAANELVLSTVCLPNQPCIFFNGSAQVQVAFGNGYLCTGGDIVRLNPPIFAAGGVASRTVDVPLEIGTAGTRYFQTWFRDPAAGGAFFNTSDAYSITFVP